MASCEENRRLLRMVVDAWEYCGRVKELVAVKDGKILMVGSTADVEKAPRVRPRKPLDRSGGCDQGH